MKNIKMKAIFSKNIETNFESYSLWCSKQVFNTDHSSLEILGYPVDRFDDRMGLLALENLEVSLWMKS